MSSARSLQHLRLGRFRITGSVHRVVVEIGRTSPVQRDTDRTGVDLPVGAVGAARRDVRLAGQTEVNAWLAESVMA